MPLTGCGSREEVNVAKAKRTDLSDELTIIRKAVDAAARLADQAEQEEDAEARKLCRLVAAVLVLATGRLRELERTTTGE